MHYFYRIFSGLLGLALFASACSSEDDLVEERRIDNLPPETTLRGTSGSVNFTKYVALGNSLTAGLMDAALYNSGQQNSFPNILAQQFQVEGVGGGAFNQPDINAENGFNTALNDLSNPAEAPFGHYVLNIAAGGVEPVTPGDPLLPYDGDRSALNNFGVPGARVIDATVAGYAQFNPFFGRFASSPEASMISDATQAQGTFFTLWLGGNDVLSWATSGGSAPDGEEDPEAQATNSATLTSIQSFTEAYQAILGSLLSVPEAKGVAISIPPVTLLPYFRAVPYNPIPLDEANANALNAAYDAQYNQGLAAAVQLGQISEEEAARRQIAFEASPTNQPVIVDEDLTQADISAAFGLPPGSRPLPNLRQTDSTDLLVLPLRNLLGEEQTEEAGPYGLQDPVTDEYVLTLNEQTVLGTRLATFNATIAALIDATGGRVALVDINPLFADIVGLRPEQAQQLGMSPEAQAAADGAIGIRVDGATLFPSFLPDGIFSTDGIHPNPKGHAVVAKEVVNVINEAFGATIPTIDTNPYRTILTPSM